MISRHLLKIFALTSLLPLASCATSDDTDDEASPLDAMAAENIINADLSLDDSISSAAENNANNAILNNGGNSNNLLLNDEGDDGVMAEGDADFDDASGNFSGPAANAGVAIEGFEDDLISEEEFINDPAPSTSNIAAANAVGDDGFASSNDSINSFKSAVGNTNAFADPTETDLSADSDILAVDAAAVNAAASTNSVPSNPAVQAPVPAPLPPAQDVHSTPSTLRWVGYRINETMKKLNVEFMTEGRPEYEIFETVNKSNQTELVFRFYHTNLRKKIKWDVNSSEFRSPVAYIRMKDRSAEGVVDLVITQRDKIQPGFFEKNGNFVLSYDIPERYFRELDLANKAKVKDKAISLSKGESAPLAKPAAVRSKLPVVGTPRYMTSFRETPKFQPIRNFITPRVRRDTKNGFPESFDRSTIRGKRTGEIISRVTLVGVAQDNLENDEFEDNDFGNENFGNNLNNNSGNGNNLNNVNNINNLNNNFGNNLNNPNNVNINANNGSNLGNPNAAPNSNPNLNSGNNLGNEGLNGNNAGFGNNASPDAFSNMNDKGAETEPNEDPFANSMTPAANSAAGKSNVQEVEPEELSGNNQKFKGKPIFMEFFDSPLNLVLKSFSEETGNNFVYPADVGSIMVTMQLKGVPWDEALKAIFETYSLGMVRIGENVVRVDKIQNLSAYMQTMEQAKQFELRRTPTKVVVFRLNNGVAKDIGEGLRAMLARDMETDNRIKISDDDRTNSVVVEAPVNILAKSKALVDRLDLETPQVEIASRIVEVRKDDNDFTGIAWGSAINFDPGRALGFGTLNFPNSARGAYSVDPGVSTRPAPGSGSLRLGSLNKFLDLDLFLKMEEKKGRTNVLQSNRILVLDGRKASIAAGSSQFFRPAAGGNVINPAPGAGGGEAAGNGLAEITFNLSLDVTPQVTALGNVIMDLEISSDTPGDVTGEALASKGTRKLTTQMVRASGDTGVIGGIYDTKRTTTVIGVPFLSDLPIIGALFRSTNHTENQTELLMMVTPTIQGGSTRATDTASNDQGTRKSKAPVLSKKPSTTKGAL